MDIEEKQRKIKAMLYDLAEDVLRDNPLVSSIYIGDDAMPTVINVKSLGEPNKTEGSEMITIIPNSVPEKRYKLKCEQHNVSWDLKDRDEVRDHYNSAHKEASAIIPFDFLIQTINERRSGMFKIVEVTEEEL